MEILYGFIILLLVCLPSIVLIIEEQKSKTTCKQCGKKTSQLKNGICIDCFCKKLNDHLEQQPTDTIKEEFLKNDSNTITKNIKTKLNIKRKEMLYKKIDRLNGYYLRGSITKEEFEEMKKEILNNQ